MTIASLTPILKSARLAAASDVSGFGALIARPGRHGPFNPAARRSTRPEFTGH